MVGRNLEKDLVLDHFKLFEGELWTEACRAKDWCAALTLRAAEAVATSTIKGILAGYGGHFAVAAVHKLTGHMVGYVHASWEASKKTLFVCHLKVAAEYQRQSVGRLLLEAALKRGRKSGWDVQSMALHVIQRNQAACGFYNRVGFQGRRVPRKDADYVSELYKYIRFEKQV